MDIDRILRKISSNLWFEWNADVHDVFRSVSPYVWGLFRRNIYRFLRLQNENSLLYRHRLTQLLVNQEFMQRVDKMWSDFNLYMDPDRPTPVSEKYPELHQKTVAYFSMEYGIDALKIYSGGLGILSGDHLRGASDMGIKMVGVGLFYLQGYYEQQISLDGEMKVNYESLVTPRKPMRDFLPVEAVKRPGTNEDLVVQVPVLDRLIRAKVWKIKIGRVELLLLDTNVRENSTRDRHVSRRLYASKYRYDEERRRRLEQEIVLGVGGVKALTEAGYKPSVFHLNEGHVALAAIEIIRMIMEQQNLSFAEAQKKAATIIGFTTHTPVPEGNERFEESMARHHLKVYLEKFLTAEQQDSLFNCARNQEDRFDMTKLALMLSGVYRNGVSQLHGEVCRKMWGYAWGNFDPEGKGVEIGAITNAVHAPYWQKPQLRKAIQNHGGLDHIHHIPDKEIWDLHLTFKRKLINKVRERLAYQMLREKMEPLEVHRRTCHLLDEEAFMIGFARRFADYKRVTMLVDDTEKLFAFMENAYRKYGKPVQIIYAGKPHPDNFSGRNKIQFITKVASQLEQRARERNFKGQLVFVQGYDIDLARYLEAGVDVWLNNPIRPLEASGTSGMKAGMNGVLNISIPDGWVPEGVQSGRNGWLFGKGNWESQDSDRDELFELLEKDVLPKYFSRSDSGARFSSEWVHMMKNSILDISKYFNTDRMLSDYIEKMYLPAVLHQSAFQYA